MGSSCRCHHLDLCWRRLCRVGGRLFRKPNGMVEHMTTLGGHDEEGFPMWVGLLIIVVIVVIIANGS